MPQRKDDELSVLKAKKASPISANVAHPAEGLLARDLAVSILFAVMVEKRPFEDSFEKASATRDLAPRDRAFARLIALSVLRHRGALWALINTYLEKPLPEHLGRLEQILLSGAAQLLLLHTPPHAAISLAVDQCHGDRLGKRFANLVNAVLRRVSESGSGRLASLDNVTLTFPDWLLSRWAKTYGPEAARAMAHASLSEPALDITVKSDPPRWAARLGGIVLPSGSVRCAHAGRVEELDGYSDGDWWVQDAAAALPIRLFDNLKGVSALDLCAAPGGKAAQLAAAGAAVTAVDKSAGRLQRLKANFERLRLDVKTVASDATAFATENTYDAVLLDVPCTATGTIRRHPDILYLKREADVAALADLQSKMLLHAASLVKVGGTLVYCTCSLEREEGEDQIEAFLAASPTFRRKPADLQYAGIPRDWCKMSGDIRTLPTYLGELPEGFRGIDGFYAAALVKGA